jgi:hypothetical protein
VTHELRDVAPDLWIDPVHDRAAFERALELTPHGDAWPDDE